VSTNVDRYDLLRLFLFLDDRRRRRRKKTDVL
jgi:hypothetical protein